MGQQEYRMSPIHVEANAANAVDVDDGEDELQDLSPRDAEELRAFVEKRKWFEAKLQILESLPPIYPFIQPFLEAGKPPGGGGRYARKCCSGSKWSLPSPLELRTWQQERDALEEEVLAFDGGDLGRMKETTRAATLLPLTPPSTHLVSITLALIVLIDRLLTLLRHRTELLALTSLRLKWDDLRWEVMQETRKIKAEIDDIVQSKGKWLPPHAREAPKGPGQTGAAKADDGSREPRVAPPRSETSSHEKNAESPECQLPASPLLIKTPRRSLALPILHSQIINLQIRYKNISTTALTRSGAALDKMIDLAASLRGLGGIDGPNDDVTVPAGAVPDELLDLQDELEAEVQEVRSRVSWVKQLEEQWDRADAHHTALTKARHAASRILDELKLVTAYPATSERHQHLSALLAGAQKLVPRDLDTAFPRPSHSSYPDQDRHNTEIMRILAEVRADALSTVDASRGCLEWYERLSKARATLLGNHSAVTRLRDDLVAVREKVLQGSTTAVRPILNQEQPLATASTWLTTLPSFADEAIALCREVSKLAQGCTLSFMQYSQILRSAPRYLPDEVPGNDDIADSLNVVSESLDKLVQRTEVDVREALQEAEIVPLVQELDAAAGRWFIAADRLELDMHQAIDTDAWDRNRLPADNRIDLKEIGKQLSTAILQEVERPREHVFELLRHFRRDMPRLRNRLDDTLSFLRAREARIAYLLDLLMRVRRQADVVREVQGEADRLISQLQRAHELLKTADLSPASITPEDLLLPPAVTVELGRMELEKRSWEDDLFRRVPLVSEVDNPSSPPSQAQLLPPSTPSAAPPTTPPPTPPAPVSSPYPTRLPQSAIHAPNDPPHGLADLDRRVRAEVNELAARISGELASARAAAASAVTSRWAERSVHLREEAQRINSEAREQLDKAAKVRRELLAVGAQQLSLEESQRNVTLSREFQAQAAEITGTFSPRIEESLQLFDNWTSSEVLQRVPELPPHELQACEYSRQSVVTLRSELATLSAEAQALMASAQTRLDDLAKSAPTAEEDADVFGSLLHRPPTVMLQRSRRSISPSLASEGGDLPRLQQRLRSLHIGDLTRPSTAALEADPALWQLPAERRARQIAATVDEIVKAARKLKPRGEQAFDGALSDLNDDLRRAKEDLPTLESLANLATKIGICDTTHGMLLERLDAEVNNVDDESAKAVQALKDVVESVAELGSDQRVSLQIRRLQRTWNELKAIRNGTSEDFDDAASDATSIVAPPSVNSSYFALPRKPSSLSIRSATSARSTSNPISSRPFPVEPRSRTLSETPARLSLEPRRQRKESSSIAVSPRGPSSIPRPARLSLSKSTVNSSPALTPRPRRSSQLPVKTLRKSKTYVPDPKSKLDVAVGRVVNTLKVNVPVVPVGVTEKDEWKDQTGRYWIGAEGRAKLYFCRILRSKSVMVRVGGGWVELSKFLLDHFSEAVWSTPFDVPSLPNGGLGVGSSIPIAITSASLATPAKSQSQTPFATPARISPALAVSADPLTPIHQASVSSGSLSASAFTSPSKSPLAPLYFIRKASESPPVREREKELFKIGRRSILGRERSFGG